MTDAIRYRIAFMAFLIFNIFLGIIGTFWFRNEYRKSEIGLRLAVGSTRRQILQMMIGEGWLLLSLVAIPAAIICINIAKMELIDTNVMPVTFFRVFAGLISTYLLMAFFITLGAWYPAYLSSKIAPADTLRAE
ncbi:FtsX-like permease family protein [Parabacteroides goldsteinii]|uniref:FtsX-like permease family protein n=1 Tax=Parabacteroides goldsteinii TaxID=328812 RepID=UPI0025AE4361|nr:FtsX-like permease family protein [Parabacteroides goldsteinii]